MAYHTVSTMIEIVEQYLHRPDLDLNCKNQIQSFLEKQARSWKHAIITSPFDIKISVAREKEDPFEQLHTRIIKAAIFSSPLDMKIALECLEFMDDEEEGSFQQLQNKIIAAAHKAEDVIETYIRNQILQLQPDNQLHLTEIVHETESIIEEIQEIVVDDADGYILPVDHLSSNSVPWYPKLDPRSKDDLTCIFQDDFHTLKSQLIQQGKSKLRIISIHGDAGMGKRTLARRLFNDPSVAAHFRTRAWLPCPLSVDEKGCLINLLEGLGMLTRELQRKDVKELKAYIRKALKKVKYLIVIYDVLTKENFVTFASLFRDYNVGARVLFTTLADNVDGQILSTYAELYQMRYLSTTESVLLFRQKVFGRQHCPYELEQIEKNIVQLCKGNANIVSLVAGVLATSENTQTVWDLVAKSLGSTLLDPEQDIEDFQLRLVILIYYHLPHYLRPCLLYTGFFYESRDIKASKIIKLWIAEGFVQHSPSECSEVIAETYLRILIDKNLLFLTHEEPSGRVRAFQSQVLLRFGYWGLAYIERFSGSKYLHDLTDTEEEKLARRVSIHGLSQPCNEMELPILARSFLSVSGASRQQVSPYLKLVLLRVLEVFHVEFYQFPLEIMQQVLLRYLTFSCYSYVSNSFSIFHNLQTLITRRLPSFRAFSLPSNLWGLSQLRHVKCKETFVLIYPKKGKEIVHKNLQTLSNMQLNGVTNQFISQIPNIRNLGIFCNVAMDTAFDLASLEKLESLKCFTDWSLASRNFLSHLTLPQSLRKLNLSLCRIHSRFMEVVGSLPSLEILKLQKSDFTSASTTQGAPTWETAEGDFPRLVSLELLDLNLVHWRTKAAHLPKLKQLIIRNCYAMSEIVFDIENIETLELIQVNESSPGALTSLMQIKTEQESRGNKFPHVLTYKLV